MARKRAPRGTPAVQAAERAGIAHTLHPYESAAASAGGEGYGLEAARLLGVEPGRVYKTLVARLNSGALVVGIVPVDRQLDLKALARAAGAKSAVMADPADAERATGYVVGGISPLGQKQRLAAYLDAGAAAWDSVHVSAGRRGLEIELAPADLQALTGAALAPIAR